MTPKQAERIKSKIKKIKAALAADKKRWGGQYHDGQGLRYMPPELYLKIGDYSGSLRYFNWFKKTFPDDVGYPDFLFEWTITLYKTKRIKEAEKKAIETFSGNSYLFDSYFGKPVIPIEKWEFSNFETKEFAESEFAYSFQDTNLADFSEWLEGFLVSDKFVRFRDAYLHIHMRLKQEHDIETRRQLIRERNLLFDSW